MLAINSIAKIDFTNLTDLKSQLESYRETVNLKNESKKAQEGAKQDLISKDTQKKDNKISYDEIGDQLKEFLGLNNVSIEFSLDQTSNRMIMKIIDNQTKEIIKQFPPDLSLQIARIVSTTISGRSLTDVTI